MSKTAHWVDSLPEYPLQYVRRWERAYTALLKGGLTPVEAGAWANHVHAAGPSALLKVIASWHRNTGMTPLEALQWHEHGFRPTTARPWVTRKWTLRQHIEFSRLYAAMDYNSRYNVDGARWQGNLRHWLQSGIPSNRCLLYFRLGFTLPETHEYERRCRDEGTEPTMALLTLQALRAAEEGSAHV